MGLIGFILPPQILAIGDGVGKYTTEIRITKGNDLRIKDLGFPWFPLTIMHITEAFNLI